MEEFMKGEVIITQFPFSDFQSTIKRPALIISTLKGDNIIVCQITTKERQDPYKILLTEKDFKSGRLNRDSFIMPSILFTIRKSRILYKVGILNDNLTEQVEEKVCEIIKS